MATVACSNALPPRRAWRELGRAVPADSDGPTPGAAPGWLAAEPSAARWGPGGSAARKESGEEIREERSCGSQWEPARAEPASAALIARAVDSDALPVDP